MSNYNWDLTFYPISLPALHQLLANQPKEAKSIRVVYNLAWNLEHLTMVDRTRHANVIKLRLEARVDLLGDLLDSLVVPDIEHLEIDFYKMHWWPLDDPRCVWPQEQLLNFLVESRPQTLEIHGINIDAEGMKSILMACDSINSLNVSGDGSDPCVEARNIALARAFDLFVQSSPGIRST